VFNHNTLLIVESDNIYHLLSEGLIAASIAANLAGSDLITLPSFTGIVAGGELDDVINIQAHDFIVACGDICNGWFPFYLSIFGCHLFVLLHYP
jgi:hypothetical protein